ncbi:MAG: hypothetical protein ACREIF_16215 [Chthoniobacterales bacterium]
MNPFAGRIRSYSHGFGSLVSVIGIAVFASLNFLQAAPADDPASKAVLDAMAKLNQTPHHEYITTTGDAAAGGTQKNEMIGIGDTNYVKIHDKWTVSPMTPKMMAEQEKENIRDAKVYRCQYERDESVNGEAAAVYKAHSENENGSSDAEIWISKSRGLPLRENIDVNGTGRFSVRFDYANVQAPAVK